MAEIVSINGKIYRPEDAKISVFDRGFLFGDAVYEVTRTYGDVLFQLEAHLDRLQRSADSIGLDLGMTQKELIKEIYDVVERSEMKDVYMRIQVSRGDGPIGMAASLVKTPNRIIYVKKLQPYNPELYTKGGFVMTVPLLRNSKRAMDPNIKSGNYLNNVIAFNLALKTTPPALELQESLLLNQEGLVTEGATSNIFMVRGGAIITPPESFDLLVGITRGLVIKCAAELGIAVKEAGFTPTELEQADEVFLTSSTREVMPVFQVNKSLVQHSPGPVTQRLARAYKEVIQRYCVRGS